jgi:uncharacterized protein (DUF2164 family)
VSCKPEDHHLFAELKVQFVADDFGHSYNNQKINAYEGQNGITDKSSPELHRYI